jgi:hypothetical protein
VREAALVASRRLRTVAVTPPPDAAQTEIQMPNMSADDLAEHLKILESATSEDLDELLEDLLVRAYPTKRNQDS